MSLATIDVRDLVGHPGASREESVSGTVEGLGTELAFVGDEPIEADLLLESVVEGILVSGHVSGTFHLRCARCLTEFEQPFDVPVHEMFVQQPDEDADEYRLEPEEGIDPEQMLRDVVGVEMPFSPLHDEACKGLCEVCGGNRNLGECPGHEQLDPRFAALADLFPDDDDDAGEDGA